MDALDVGLDAMLVQDFPGEEHPVQYLSRELFPRGRVYSTIEKEALAIKWAIISLRYYLLDNPISLIIIMLPYIIRKP